MFIIFFVSALAETNRPPFDLPEAEAELVAGYQENILHLSFFIFSWRVSGNFFNVCNDYDSVFRGVGYLLLIFYLNVITWRSLVYAKSSLHFLYVWNGKSSRTKI